MHLNRCFLITGQHMGVVYRCKKVENHCIKHLQVFFFGKATMKEYHLPQYIWVSALVQIKQSEIQSGNKSDQYSQWRAYV